MLTKAQLFQAEDQTKIVEERLVLITNSRVRLKYHRMTIGSTNTDKEPKIINNLHIHT